MCFYPSEIYSTLITLRWVQHADWEKEQRNEEGGELSQYIRKKETEKKEETGEK